jgi:hypothetical protein
MAKLADIFAGVFTPIFNPISLQTQSNGALWASEKFAEIFATRTVGQGRA